MGNALKIDLYPKVCNLCGGSVIYVSNALIYGKPYGSGYCYLCQHCGAYVGTHKPRPKEAFGILANAEMREAKKYCHNKFDALWKTREQRKALYSKLAEAMSIPVSQCHFGYFDLEQLGKAAHIIQSWEVK